MGGFAKKITSSKMTLSNIFVSFVLFALSAEALFSIVGVFIFIYEKRYIQKKHKDKVVLNKDEIENQNLSQSIFKDIISKSLIQNSPTIIGISTIIISLYTKSSITQSLGFFIIGFTGIFRMTILSRYIPEEYYFMEKKTVGNVLLTLFAWGFAIHVLSSK